MNKVVWKDNLREIKHSLPRFLSIFAIITLGVAFFVGIRATGPSMLDTTRIYYETYHLPDGHIFSTMGLEDEDIAILNQQEGIQVLPMQTVQATIQPSNEIGKIYTFNGDESTNFFKVVEGRLPTSENEIALDAKYLSYLNENLEQPINIGAIVTLEVEEESPTTSATTDQASDSQLQGPHLLKTEFEVVGFVDSPIYFERISRGQGNNNVYGVVIDSVIAGDLYSEAFYWVDAARELEAYTDEYDQTVGAVHENLVVAYDNRPEVRIGRMQDEFDEGIAAGQREIDEGYQLLNQGSQSLTDAEKKLDDGWQQYYAGLDELASGEASFREGLLAYQEGVDAYQTGLAELESAEALLVENEASYEAGLAEYQNGLQAYYDGIALGEQELLSNQALLNQTQAQLEAGYQDLVAGQEALDLGRQQLISGRQQFINEIVTAVSNGEMTSQELVQAINEQRSQIQVAQTALQNQINQLNPQENQLLIEQLEQAQTELNNLDQFIGQSEGVLNQLVKGEISLEQAQSQVLADNQALNDLLLELGIPVDASLTDVIGEMNAQRDSLLAEIENIEYQINQLPEEIQGLEAEVFTLEEEIKGLEQTVADNQVAVSDQLQVVNQAATNLAQQQQLLSEQQTELNQQEAYLAQLKAEREALLVDPESNQAQINVLDQQIAQTEQPVAELQARVSSQTNITNQAESTYNQNVAELERLEAELSANQTELDNLQTQLSQKQLQLEQLRQVETNLDYDVLQEQMDALRAQEAALNEDINLLNEAIEQLNQAETEINQGQTELDQGWASYYSGLSQYQAGQAALDLGWSVFETERAQGLQALNEAADQLASGRQQLDEGWAAYYAGQAELEVGYEELLAARDEIITGYQALTDGRYQAMDGRTALEIGQENLRASQLAFNQEANDAVVELRNGQSDLNDAKLAFDDINEPIYFVNQRDGFDAYSSVYENAQQLNVISNIFPVFFFGIAVLVTFTTIKRMASEQRNYMGTMKQMGYPNHVILSKFVTYAGIASILGVIVGIVLGYLIFPPVIINAYNSLFYFDTLVVKNSWTTNLFVTIIGLGCAILPAIITPHRILKTQAANLLQPEPPKAGKKTIIERFTFLWRRLGYKQQMTIRNLLRYKGRNSMTLVGVAGCTMLIVTGFGISTTISTIVTNQFNELHQYDSLVMLNEDLEDNEQTSLEDTISQYDEIDAYTKTMTVNFDTDMGGASQSVTVVVPLDDQFSEIMTIRERDAQVAFDLAQDGPIITERLSEYFELAAGDPLKLLDSDQQPYTLTVGGIAENYVGHYLYLSAEDYQQIFKQAPYVNSYYISYDQKDDSEWIEEELADNEFVLATINVDTISRTASDAMASLDLITIVLIISAAGLAFVVLYNLTNINVAERMRELSTIKVLGFYNHEVTMYIASEVLVLTFLGSLIGLVLGTLLNHYILKTMQLNNLLFNPTISLTDYLLSVIITFVFAIIVMISMHFKLKKIDMVEALKAVE
ncbi:FtsX-like permease family protein [Fundicoccus culcitae]|uniref:FtsX-like permease family protein n=1 Tax=Fundicoccus culcitae TaxID=2969821 RepID=A0ABY5P4Z8_9LACT|nr:FtsX-like permease family protein [Fundicoccus culcitae]UUX33818.1 FtsX-like permease family protein [Fundicoccus culcitae]